jgi:FtsZ-interacting cell division protein ZipA
MFPLYFFHYFFLFYISMDQPRVIIGQQGEIRRQPGWYSSIIDRKWSSNVVIIMGIVILLLIFIIFWMHFSEKNDENCEDTEPWQKYDPRWSRAAGGAPQQYHQAPPAPQPAPQLAPPQQYHQAPISVADPTMDFKQMGMFRAPAPAPQQNIRFGLEQQFQQAAPQQQQQFQQQLAPAPQQQQPAPQQQQQQQQLAPAPQQQQQQQQSTFDINPYNRMDGSSQVIITHSITP